MVCGRVAIGIYFLFLELPGMLYYAVAALMIVSGLAGSMAAADKTDEKAQAQAAKHRADHGRRSRLQRPRLLWRRNPHAEPGCPGGRWAALHAILQLHALLSDASVIADRPVSTHGQFSADERFAS